jgi:uncharacterized protein (TIGR03086 family)
MLVPLRSATNREAQTPCAQWTITQVLQHATGDQLAWAAALGVGTGPAENPFTPSGHIEADIGDLIEPALATARTAWAGVRSDDDAVPTPLPQGRLHARVAAGACALDAAVHAWDIAAALGRPGFLPCSLTEQLFPAAQVIVEPLRPFAYATALAPQPDDDATAQLLRYLGRDPQWQAAPKRPTETGRLTARLPRSPRSPHPVPKFHYISQEFRPQAPMITKTYFSM